MVDLAEQGIYIIVAMFGFMFWFMDYRNTKRINKLEAIKLERELKDEDAQDVVDKLKQSVFDYVKASITDYVDRELLYVKKELGWAIKLIDKDIKALKEAVTFLNQFTMGTKVHSPTPSFMTTGEAESQAHKLEPLSGLFKDTKEEIDDKIDEMISDDQNKKRVKSDLYDNIGDNEK
jgi:hypothetical protein